MRLSEEQVAKQNRRMAEAAREHALARSEVDACWSEEWLAFCGDPECLRRHHYDVTCAAVRPPGSDWPVAVFSVGKDRHDVVMDLTKPQLAQIIADLQELLESLP